MKEVLKSLRAKEHLTQEEFAKKISVNISTYKQYETDRTEPNIDTLIKIANYFDVSMDYLCGRPRPYDLPSAATDSQRMLVKKILSLTDRQCELVNVYIAGMVTAETEKVNTIKKLRGEKYERNN